MYYQTISILEKDENNWEEAWICPFKLKAQLQINRRKSFQGVASGGVRTQLMASRPTEKERLGQFDASPNKNSSLEIFTRSRFPNDYGEKKLEPQLAANWRLHWHGKNNLIAEILFL